MFMKLMSQKQATNLFKGGIGICYPIVMCLKIPDTTIKPFQVTYLSFHPPSFFFWLVLPQMSNKLTNIVHMNKTNALICNETLYFL